MRPNYPNWRGCTSCNGAGPLLEHLSEFLQERIRAGTLRSVPDVPAAARFIVETIAWFAMHRYSDPDSMMLDDATSRSTVRHLLMAAFTPSTGPVEPGT